MSKSTFYRLDEIDKLDATYNVIFGERSNGKTFAVLERILKNWIDHGEQGAYIRRFDEEIKGAKGDQVFAAVADKMGLVDKYTNGQWTSVTYYNRKWYLSKWDEKLQKNVKQGEPFCHAFAVNQGMHFKGTSYPEITTICFDEFLHRKRDLPDEFVEFANIVSTIVRQDDKARIYMLGNTVNKYSTYFDEMGLTNVGKMKIGSIDLYEYGEGNGLTVAVEYCKPAESGKASDKYFAFDNPKLKMITQGSWELPMYPHAPFKIDPRNILDVFFIEYRGSVMQGDIVLQDESLFIFMHEKTTPIKDDEKILYRMKSSPKYNHAVHVIGNRRNKMMKRISDMFLNGLVYYQNNNIGELTRNYLHESDRAVSLD